MNDTNSGSNRDAQAACSALPEDQGAPELDALLSELGADPGLPPRVFVEAVEQSPVAISITDPNARILYVNSLFELLTGYKKADVIGKNESVLSSRSTPVTVYQDLWRAIQDKRTWFGNLVNHRRNGQEYLAELMIAPVLGADQQIQYYLGMHRDVTEMHQLQQRLQFQHNLTEAALDSAPLAIAMLDSERRVLLDNHAYKVLLGDFQGAEPADLLLDALERELGFNLASACQSGKGFAQIEVRIDPPGGQPPRWFSCSGARVAELDEAAKNYFKSDGDGRCYLLLVTQEITASRNRAMEARLNLIRANIAEQRSVQSMREAILGAIFKLQVPLNLIRAALSLPGAEANPEHSHLLQVLSEALSTADDAVADLRSALPAPRQEESTEVNLVKLLDDVLRLSTPQLLASGIVVDWQPTHKLPDIEGQPNALRGLFKSLVDNAIQAIQESHQTQRLISIRSWVEDQDLLVELMDTGTGVASQDRLRLFEPFYCGWKDSREHSGMGLTVAQEVVLEHNGSLEIDPEFIGGCRICVRLPLPERPGATA